MQWLLHIDSKQGLMFTHQPRQLWLEQQDNRLTVSHALTTLIYNPHTVHRAQGTHMTVLVNMKMHGSNAITAHVRTAASGAALHIQSTADVITAATGSPRCAAAMISAAAAAAMTPVPVAAGWGSLRLLLQSKAARGLHRQRACRG
jgi:hypothetical protein